MTTRLDDINDRMASIDTVPSITVSDGRTERDYGVTVDPADAAYTAAVGHCAKLMESIEDSLNEVHHHYVGNDRVHGNYWKARLAAQAMQTDVVQLNATVNDLIAALLALLSDRPVPARKTRAS